MSDAIKLSEVWRRCERCGFATAISKDLFDGHECIVRLADPEAPQLAPLFHATCGAVVLYSIVPIESGQRVPHWSKLLLVDGKTPMWTPSRAMLLNRKNPPAVTCQNCGGSTNRALRTRPALN